MMHAQKWWQGSRVCSGGFSHVLFSRFAFFDFLTSTTSFSVQASDCAKG
jgi:hypothetical protein